MSSNVVSLIISAMGQIPAFYSTYFLFKNKNESDFETQCVWHDAEWLIVCSVYNCRVHHVLLEPPVLPGMVRRRYPGWPRYLRHDGAYCRVVVWCLQVVQGGRQHVQLDTHRAGVGWRCASLSVRSEAFRRCLQSWRKLYVYVAQA